jgi:excisionase family DNA binding protein
MAREGRERQKKRGRGAGCANIAERRAESRSMGNATATSNKSRSIVNTNCPYVVEFCTGRILKPLASARFEVVGNIATFDREAEENLISVAEAASRLRLKPKTLYCWIEKGRLQDRQGLRTLGTRHRIDWSVLEACRSW